MKKYERASHKIIILHSIEIYTTSISNGKEVLFNRKNKKRNLPTDNQYDGKGWSQSRRDSASNWFSSPQHQQNIQGKRSSIYRFSIEDSRMPGVRGRDKINNQKKDAS